MSHTKQVAQALGQVAKSRVKKHGEAKPSDRQVADRTWAAIHKTILVRDRWEQTEGREVLAFKDSNGGIWRLNLVNKHARLHLFLSRERNGANLEWTSQSLVVGGLVQKENERVGFGVTTDISEFLQWRRGVMRDRPETHPSRRSS